MLAFHLREARTDRDRANQRDVWTAAAMHLKARSRYRNPHVHWLHPGIHRVVCLHREHWRLCRGDQGDWRTSSDSECCIATPEKSQFLCNIGTTEFFCTGNNARSCTWTCAAPPSPPPDGSTARDTSGCDEEDFKSSFFESTSSGPSNCIVLGFVVCFGGAPQLSILSMCCTTYMLPLRPRSNRPQSPAAAPYRLRLRVPLRRPPYYGAPRGRKRCDTAY